MSDMTEVACNSRNLSGKRTCAPGQAEQKIIEGFRRLTDDEKRKVLRLIDLLIYHPEDAEG